MIVENEAVQVKNTTKDRYSYLELYEELRRRYPETEILHDADIGWRIRLRGYEVLFVPTALGATQRKHDPCTKWAK